MTRKKAGHEGCSFIVLTKVKMAEASSRVLWRGAISFGLLHIPLGLHSATTESGLDFDWLDKHINKKTGKYITQ